MKAFALVLGLCLLPVLAAAPVEAHEAWCHIENFSCVTRCERDHLTTSGPHACYYYGLGHLRA